MWLGAELFSAGPGDEAPGIRSFELVPKTPDYPRPMPGQHIILEARVDGRSLRRSYTISSPRRQSRLRITIKQEEGGLLSSWLFARPRGAVPVRITRPLGAFGVNPAAEKTVCLVAGIGVTPALALAGTLADEGLITPVCIHYSGKTYEHMAGLPELQEAAQERPNLELILRETQKSGRLTAPEVLALVNRKPQADYYLCGPAGYLEQIAGFLRAGGVPQSRIHAESFTPSRKRTEAPLRLAELRASQRYMLVPPTPEPESWLLHALRGLGKSLSTVANHSYLNFCLGGIPLNPLHIAERLLSRQAGIDPALPYEYLALVGDLAEGNLLHQRRFFACLDAHGQRNRERAVQARRQGQELPASTPDGDTFAYVLPAIKLIEIPKPCAVDTGWTRSSPGNLVPVYVIRGRSALDHVLRRSEHIDRGALPYYYLQQMMGRRDLATCPERQAAGLGAGRYRHNATWTEDRTAATELFGLPAIEQLGAMMEAALPNICTTIDDALMQNPEVEVDLNVLTSKIAYLMIIRVIFGNVDLTEFHALGQKLTESVRRMFDYTIQLTYGRSSVPPDYVHHNLEVRNTTAEMIRMLRDLDRRNLLSESQRAVPTVRMVLESTQNSGGDLERLVTLFLPFIFGGHETTGHSLCWALYEVARDRELEAKLVSEIEHFQATAEGMPLSRADYEKRPITFALLAETLRRHVLSSSISRVAQQAGVVPPDPDTGIGGFSYPVGTFFLASPVGVHSDSRRWPAPWKFSIDRFLEGTDKLNTVEERGRQVLKNIRSREEALDLLSFGHGPARCPGAFFNMHESVLVLDALLSRYHFELTHPEREVQPSRSPLIGPEAGTVGVHIRKRQSWKRNREPIGHAHA
jgi:ferredoxin-NADP reductase/cytochrome P450